MDVRGNRAEWEWVYDMWAVVLGTSGAGVYYYYFFLSFFSLRFSGLGNGFGAGCTFGENGNMIWCL